MGQLTFASDGDAVYRIRKGDTAPAAQGVRTIELFRKDPGVLTEDAIAAMGSVVRVMSERAPRVLYFRMEWIWDIGYWLSTSVPPLRWLARSLLGRVGARGLVDLVRRTRPDVIVSTWPGSTACSRSSSGAQSRRRSHRARVRRRGGRRSPRSRSASPSRRAA